MIEVSLSENRFEFATFISEHEEKFMYMALDNYLWTLSNDCDLLEDRVDHFE